LILFGLDAQIATFRAAIASERMHHAWLLAGPRGIAKASFADFAARILLNADDPESSNAKLLDAGSHPDFRRLERLPNEKTGNLARNITVDQVRYLRALFAMGTSICDRRVIIIDSVDDMERGAANALLKSLEEPPKNTIFLLVSHQPGRLLPTIGPLDDVAMTQILKNKIPDADEEALRHLVASGKGSPAAAIAYVEFELAAIQIALVELSQTGDPSNIVRSGLVQSLSLKAAQPRYEAFLRLVPSLPIMLGACRGRRSTLRLKRGAGRAVWRKSRPLSRLLLKPLFSRWPVMWQVLLQRNASLKPERCPASPIISRQRSAIRTVGHISATPMRRLLPMRLHGFTAWQAATSAFRPVS
jgi:DNA polymerase III subunit delta'